MLASAASPSPSASGSAGSRPPEGFLARLLRPEVASLIAFLVVSLIVDLHLTGDGPDYAREVHQRLTRTNPSAMFWDAGHLIWRPLVYVLMKIALALGAPATAADISNVARLLMVVSWLGGLASVMLLPKWLVKNGTSAPSATWASVTLMTTNAFLGYVAGGSAYVPGLACLLAGLYLLSLPHSTARTVAAGIFTGISVLLWLPFVFVLPAALFAQPLLQGPAPERIRSGVMATLACAVVGALAYGVAAAHIGIHSVAAFSAWLSESSHGITHVRGLPKAVFGFSRSFINMGHDGQEFKRFFLHDPYNPISPVDLFRTGLLKFLYFYLVVAMMAVLLWKRRQGVIPWLFCAVMSIPVLAFGVAWQGGDAERYVPMYPAFLLGLAFMLDATGKWRLANRAAGYIFIAIVIVANVTVLSRPGYAAAEEKQLSRVYGFTRDRLPTPRSFATVPATVDGLQTYLSTGATRALKLPVKVPVLGLVTPGVENTIEWRKDFARRALVAWDESGRAWISHRLLSPRPERTWGWVEGDDPRLTWGDFPKFFAPFDKGESFDGAEGYTEILPTQHNRDILAATLAAPTPVR